jgi:hypothetical protein
MAAAHVQTVSASKAAAITTTSPSITLTAGNAVIVTLIFDSSSGGVGTITQPGGDTTTVAHSYDQGAQFSQIRICHVVAGGATTFTFNWANPQKSCIFVSEVSGLLSASAFDASSTSATEAIAAKSTGTTGTLAQADEYAHAVWNADASGNTSNTPSLTNGFVVPTNGGQLTPSPADGAKGAIAYAVTTTTAGKETTLTASDAILANALMATFKAAAVSTQDLYLRLDEPVIGGSTFQ